jgi:hypothetical protein
LIAKIHELTTNVTEVKLYFVISRIQNLVFYREKVSQFAGTKKKLQQHLSLKKAFVIFEQMR